jgi:hypothetical protein
MSNTFTIGEPLEDSYDLRILNKNGETIFKIDENGIISYMKDGKLKTFEEEKELSTIFVHVISGLSGFNFQNRDEIIQKVIKDYRNGQIDNLLGE